MFNNFHVICIIGFVLGHISPSSINDEVGDCLHSPVPDVGYVHSQVGTLGEDYQDDFLVSPWTVNIGNDSMVDFISAFLGLWLDLSWYLPGSWSCSQWWPVWDHHQSRQQPNSDSVSPVVLGYLENKPSSKDGENSPSKWHGWIEK